VGIDKLKQHQICITPSSTNLISEIRSYKRKVRNGEITDDIVKEHDHGLDASRYGLHTHLTEPITPRRVAAARI
jgi:phage terminase large subunit